jgi:hypothetical protein
MQNNVHILLVVITDLSYNHYEKFLRPPLRWFILWKHLIPFKGD